MTPVMAKNHISAAGPLDGGKACFSDNIPPVLAAPPQLPKRLINMAISGTAATS